MGRMSFIGVLERFFGEVIFPNLAAFVALLALAVVVLSVVAIRRRWDRPLRRHPRLAIGGLAAVLVVALPLAWILASPLFVRTALDEPMASGPSGAPAGEVVLEGTFVGADDFHFGRGFARIVVDADGVATLRLEDFSVLNGPDLRVYLSPDTGYSADAAEVGPLRATDGSFGYVLDGFQIDATRSVLIWCEPFGVLFASASLAPPS